MFTYLDPAIRKRLAAQGTLFQIDSNGVVVGDDQQGLSTSTISVLGPIPLPLKLCDTEVKVQWYACVHNTELEKIEKLATDLREQNGQKSFARLASFM